ncbi:hypothetical protein [Candidatus Leptofilum sp.]|uniref:hypothetical protein n=1 Tax=Candidatus Leptofilum sp. TaxID=3241576 RepID=UPI003B5B218F
MNNIDMQSVLKAGGIGAGVAILLGVLSFIPVVGGFIAILFLCGGFFIPVASGMLYGYFAPGKEDTATAAIGGALAGGASGILLAIFNAISTTVVGAATDSVGSGLAGGAMSGVVGALCFGIMGFVLGAVGGLVWPFIQNQMGGN